MYDVVPLSALRPGQTGQVEHVLGAVDQVHRLQELGVCGGASVEMIQAGSPCIVLLAGQKLCFRAAELLSVLVRPGTAS